jgi:3-oxoacyl-[acyl-carrier-protein] synthase III
VKKPIRAALTAVGGYLPEKIITNDDLSKIVDTSDEWIRERSGIRERRQAAPDQTVSDLATFAAKNALAKTDLHVNDIDFIITATATAERAFPSVSATVQHRLQMNNLCPAFDVSAACGGFIYALATADAFIRAGEVKRALVIGAETFSRITDYTDRATCVLFGDGAGAFILSAQETEEKIGVLSTVLHADGSLGEILKTEGGAGDPEKRHPYVRMEGREVFKNAVTVLSEVMGETLTKAGVSAEEVDFIIPHQANIRIMEATAKKIGLSPEKMISVIDRHGNTSAASIPLAYAHAFENGLLKPGNLTLTEAVGGGLVWGGALIRL